jgi:hypothetical protein
MDSDVSESGPAQATECLSGKTFGVAFLSETFFYLSLGVLRLHEFDLRIKSAHQKEALTISFRFAARLLEPTTNLMGRSQYPGFPLNVIGDVFTPRATTAILLIVNLLQGYILANRG